MLIKHGAYIKRYDGRTRAGRCVNQIENELIIALGGQITPQERLLIERIATKVVRCSLIERELLTNKDAPATLQNDFLRWSRSLREDLKAIGLRTVPRPVQDLQQYVEATYG